jgi:DNA-binding transcriptional regulator YhcF (GntR family)
MPMATLNMVRVDRRQKAALQLQLCKQIPELIISGQLKAGVRLPSTRDLVSQLGVSRNTIVYALDQLVAEGYLSTTIIFMFSDCVDDQFSERFTRSRRPRE